MYDYTFGGPSDVPGLSCPQVCGLHACDYNFRNTLYFFFICSVY